MQCFGEKLRTLRTQRDMSQRDLAHALGYTNANAYISDFENGKRRPTLDFALKVAEFFNVSLDLLLRDGLDIPGVDETGTVKGEDAQG